METTLPPALGGGEHELKSEDNSTLHF